MSNTKVVLGDILGQEMSNLHDPYTQYTTVLYDTDSSWLKFNAYTVHLYTELKSCWISVIWGPNYESGLSC